jgi:hypothetical protein
MTSGCFPVEYNGVLRFICVRLNRPRQKRDLIVAHVGERHRLNRSGVQFCTDSVSAREHAFATSSLPNQLPPKAFGATVRLRGLVVGDIGVILMSGISIAFAVVGWAEVDAGKRPGASTDMTARMKGLERENRELRQANEILRKASAYFAVAELDRRSKT